MEQCRTLARPRESVAPKECHEYIAQDAGGLGRQTSEGD
jgi:hypothetical protein